MKKLKDIINYVFLNFNKWLLLSNFDSVSALNIIWDKLNFKDYRRFKIFLDFIYIVNLIFSIILFLTFYIGYIAFFYSPKDRFEILILAIIATILFIPINRFGSKDLYRKKTRILFIFNLIKRSKDSNSLEALLPMFLIEAKLTSRKIHKIIFQFTKLVMVSLIHEKKIKELKSFFLELSEAYYQDKDVIAITAISRLNEKIKNDHNYKEVINYYQAITGVNITESFFKFLLAVEDYSSKQKWKIFTYVPKVFDFLNKYWKIILILITILVLIFSPNMFNEFMAFLKEFK